MADKINYGVYPNPLPDAEGKTTYQVRHIPNGTMSEKGAKNRERPTSIIITAGSNKR